MLNRWVPSISKLPEWIRMLLLVAITALGIVAASLAFNILLDLIR